MFVFWGFHCIWGWRRVGCLERDVGVFWDACVGDGVADWPEEQVIARLVGMTTLRMPYVGTKFFVRVAWISIFSGRTAHFHDVTKSMFFCVFRIVRVTTRM